MSWYLNNEDKLILSTRNVYEGGRYIQADYIEFDWEHNGGYIDTGIVDDGQDTWLVNFEYLDIGVDNHICGTVCHPHGVAWVVGTDTGTSWYYGQGQFHYTSGVTVNQRISCSKSPWGSYPFTNPIYLGCLNWSPEGGHHLLQQNPSHFRVYKFEISRNNTFLSYMRPAYDTVNEEWGMYDETRNQFFGNAGGEGTSIAGGYYSEDVTDITPEVLAFDYNDPPAAMWRLDDDILVNGLLPEPLVDDQGAFNKCLNLVYVEIPESVKSIGRYSFRETQLKKVKIASNCTYYDTSFPADCVITFYS